MAPAIKESKVDVLIVGAGPAGLMAANWMARTGVNARIIDKRSNKIFTGQADGLQVRTLEVLQSFGIAERVWRESNHMIEIAFWNPGPDGTIHRTGRIPDTIPGLSRFQQVVLHQGRIERFFLDDIKRYGNIVVERGVLPEKLEIDTSKVEDPEAYPISIQLRQLTDEEATPKAMGATANGLFRSNVGAAFDKDDQEGGLGKAEPGSLEVVHAKYVMGCDGAHSWVRRQIGAKMEGEPTDFIWGVIDAVPITNFPDIRLRCAIHSKENGSVMIIPRENELVRFYIQLVDQARPGEIVDRSKITSDIILNAAKKIMAPYTLECPEIDWYTAYQIGQRVTDSFSMHDRIFISGDACHTHSPKAGQGMNVSMADAYCLGWKVAHVVQGLADRSILQTYQSERRRVAQDLIAFDHKFSRLFSGKPAEDAADEFGISMTEFQKVFEKGNMFASGIAVDYGKSMLIAKSGSAEEQGDGTHVAMDSNVEGKQELSSVLKIGMRFPSAQVLCHADGRPWELQDRLPSDGRWRILVFAGNVGNEFQMARVQKLGSYLSSSKGVVKKYTPKGWRSDTIIEVLSVHSTPRTAIEWSALPEAFIKPGDLWRAYTDDDSYHSGHGRAYEKYGIDKERGLTAIIRPDGYVAYLGDLEDTSDLDKFFGAFMRTPPVNKVTLNHNPPRPQAYTIQ